MNEENLRLLRNILYRIFVIGILVTALALWIVSAWTGWPALAAGWFHTDAAALPPLLFRHFMAIRFFLLYIVLVPALALHWTLCSIRCCKKKADKACCGGHGKE